MRTCRILAVCGIALAIARPAAAQAVTADLPLGPDNAERVILLPAQQPRATVVLLPGGDGVIGIGIGPTGSIDRGGNAYSPHGYLGIEDQVVQRIADWITAPGR